MKKDDLLLRDMVFIAEEKATGERYEFTLFDLQGWDDETVFINIWSEPGHCPQIPLVAPAWDRIRSENETYIFRLKRPDEEEAGLHKRNRITGVKVLPGCRLEITFCSGETRRSRSLADKQYPVSPGSYDFRPLGELYTEEEFARIAFTQHYLLLPDGRRLRPHYL